VSQDPKTGVLLVNLGTPDAPDVPSVRRYLAEFLMDPRVIDTSAIARALLVYGAVLPFRPQKSAAQYRTIWTDRGSPLLSHGLDLRAALAARLGDVRLAMRYGNPSLTAALDGFEKDGVGRIVVVPLYPQYASSSTGSTLDAIYSWAASRPVTPVLAVVPPFYAHAGFLDPFAVVARPATEGADHVLMSFHGLPERQVRATDHSGRHCLASPDCCAAIGTANRDCYRAQCFATARGLASRLGLAADRWSVSFQSRLGRTPWIQPFTDVVLPELRKKGVDRIAVLCPSFVADCLETLEEIGVRAREQWSGLGGAGLTLAPSLNADPRWVEGLAGIIEEAAPIRG
jgi:protoporphyrin/coproporphyrin ferrochelatase